MFSRSYILTLSSILFVLNQLALAHNIPSLKQLTARTIAQQVIALSKSNPEVMAAHIQEIAELPEDAKLTIACHLIDWDSSGLTRLQRIYFAFEYGLLLLAHNQKASIMMLAQTIFHNTTLSVTPRILSIANNMVNHIAIYNQEQDAIAMDLLLDPEHGYKYVPLAPYFQPFCTLAQARCCKAIRQNDLITLSQLLPLARLFNTCNGNISPLQLTCALDKPDCLELLLQYCSNIDEQGTNDITTLMSAAQYGSLVCLKRLLEAKANINGQNNDAETALMSAASMGQINCLQELINHKADVNVASFSGMTPLILAAQKGSPDCVASLIKAKAAVNAIAIKTKGISSVRQAAQNGHLTCLRLLIEAQANINIQDDIGCTPLSIAVDREHHECVQELINAHADVNIARFNGVTPLMLASELGSLACINRLINAKAEVNPIAVKANGISSIRQAAQNGHLDCLRLLIEAQANVNIQDKDGSTPLMMAAFKGSHQCIQELINADADVNLVDNTQQSALMHAAANRNLKCVKQLLKAKANPLLRDRDNDTAQNYALVYGHTEIAQLLEQAEIDYLEQK